MPLEIDSLKDLMVHELKDLYNAETQILEALPKLRDAASNPKLKEAFKEHLEETKTHVKRLEDIFKDLDYKPGGQHCDAMEGLAEEGEEVIKEDMPDDVKDAALICAAQRVEHYEMAGYGCVRTFAKLLGYKEIASTLQKTLDEEGAADKKLTSIAESGLNLAAVDG